MQSVKGGKQLKYPNAKGNYTTVMNYNVWIFRLTNPLSTSHDSGRQHSKIFFLIFWENKDSFR